MFFGITFLLRRGKKFILCIIVDHSLGENLIICVTFGRNELLFHKGCHLVHI